MSSVPERRFTNGLDESTDFSFQPLSAPRNQIRILSLLPGSWVDDIRCELKTASLDDNPLYHALSYAWHHHSTRSKIFVDGYGVHVTPSLEAALREIRQPDDVLYLWVDKLCINQDDEKEKSHQVGQMHRVFRQCSNALIWLGPADVPVEAAERHELLRSWSRRSTWSDAESDFVYSFLKPFATCFAGLCGRRGNRYMQLLDCDEDVLDDPFAIIMHFAADKHISDLPCFFRKGRQKKLVFRENARFRAMWLRFRQLLETTWHSRFWCVQEALLPNNAWVLYGSWRIPFATIMNSLRNHRKHLFTCCSGAEKLFGSAYAFCPDSLYFSLPRDRNLDTLLRMYRYKGCRDPRDKVFGIQALVNHKTNIEVDYSLSVAEVYTRAMSTIIRHSGEDLRCFTGAGFGSRRHGLPSWVRDLDIQQSIAAVQIEMRRLEAYDLYNAAGILSSQVSMQRNRKLQLSGLLIDTVKHVCAPLDVPIEQFDWKHGIRVLLTWHRAANAAGDKTSLFSPNVRKQAFWRTILGDLIWVSEHSKFRRFVETDVDDYEHWLRNVLRDWLTWRSPAMVDAFVQPLLCATYSRSLFTTTSGNLGLCYPDVRPGDEVWVLKGGKVPFVLRSKRLTNDHELVGDCYLHGFMDGGGYVIEDDDVPMIEIS